MNNLTVTMGEPSFETDAPGLGQEHHAWAFMVTGTESDAFYTGTYRAGIGVKPWTVGFADVLRSLAMDVTDESLCGDTRPLTVREVIEYLSSDVGFNDALGAYDAAAEMHRLAVWYWSLTPGEQAELCSYADEEED